VGLRDTIRARLLNDREDFFYSINVGQVDMKTNARNVLYDEWLEEWSKSSDPFEKHFPQTTYGSELKRWHWLKYETPHTIELRKD
jgi:hypothetical protein